jgi:hypothetical protein
LAQVLGRNQGPTKLDLCDIDNFVLVDGLRGNSRLKSFRPRISTSDEDRNREVLAIASALRENKGLVTLYPLCSLYGGDSLTVSNEAWGAICDSLETHPTLEVLNLRAIIYDDDRVVTIITSRIQALLDILKLNMSIHTIHLHPRYCQHEHFLGSVIPYLETNRLRPRVRAIQKTRPITYRAKVLGRALMARSY